MDKIVTENLFLLEFLVDNVRLDPSACRDLGDISGSTCVSVQFLDNPPLDICEDDFSPKSKYCPQESANIKSGKSCLFSLTPRQAEEAIYQFDAYVSVFKKIRAGSSFEKIQVGNSLISIVNLFNDLIASVNVPASESSPAAKTLKDTFQIANSSGQYVGDIGMYIRMSCFGKLIVTQFQMNLEDKSVLFKDKEGHSLYRYKKACQKNSNELTSSNTCYAPCPTRSSGQPISSQVNAPCSLCMQQAPSNSMGESTACYQEIGASMGGNALTIRVHKDKKLEPLDVEDESCTCTNSYPTGKQNYPRAVAGGSACPCTDPSVVMRPGLGENGPNNPPFAFKLGGCGMASQNNVTVVPPVATTPDGTQYTELSDPNRDVFILRIGKKSEGTDKKNNLELELCTPKGPDLKPTPKKETRDTQWENSDCPSTGGSASGNGKGAKGGKKGKK